MIAFAFLRRYDSIGSNDLARQSTNGKRNRCAAQLVIRFTIAAALSRESSPNKIQYPLIVARGSVPRRAIIINRLNAEECDSDPLQLRTAIGERCCTFFPHVVTANGIVPSVRVAELPEVPSVLLSWPAIMRIVALKIFMGMLELRVIALVIVAASVKVLILG